MPSSVGIGAARSTATGALPEMDGLSLLIGFGCGALVGIVLTLVAIGYVLARAELDGGVS